MFFSSAIDVIKFLAHSCHTSIFQWWISLIDSEIIVKNVSSEISFAIFQIPLEKVLKRPGYLKLCKNDAIFNSMSLLMVVLHLLQLNDEKLTHLQLIGMARGVASGMAYLSAMNFIHRVMKIFC